MTDDTHAIPAAIRPLFLRDVRHGGAAHQPRDVALALTEFCSKARANLHIAIYDFRLDDALGRELIDTLKERAEAGVDVRIAYDHTKPNTSNAAVFAALGGDPAPKGTHARMQALFAGTQVQTRPVLTIPAALADSEVLDEPIAGSHLMHSKYIVRDVHTRHASVLMGSANFTTDAWTHQENNIVQLDSAPLAAHYETDFQELWSTGRIESTGVHDIGQVHVGGHLVDLGFSPGEGHGIEAHIAGLIAGARQRIKVCSMILSSHAILGALSDALHAARVSSFSGIYDATQMHGIVSRWDKTGNPAATTFGSLATHWVGKKSTPYSPTAMHDFMHNKVVVCDNAVVTGSFNFSANATHNAENCLTLHSAALADAYSDYIDALVTAYG
jgi:phosphatidylserine/phosphatidylglycerophosphate/cardiolipin synthase-like enzyme